MEGCGARVPARSQPADGDAGDGDGAAGVSKSRRRQRRVRHSDRGGRASSQPRGPAPRGAVDDALTDGQGGVPAHGRARHRAGHDGRVPEQVADEGGQGEERGDGPRQVLVPGEHEPRDSHPTQRHHRGQRAAVAHPGPHRGAARAHGHGHQDVAHLTRARLRRAGLFQD